MNDKLVNLDQLRQLSTRANDLIGQVAGAAAEALEELDAKKQDENTALTEARVLELIRMAGGFSPQIIVTVAAGAVVTCSRGSKSFQQIAAEGTAVFNVPDYGIWSISAVRGEKIGSAEVRVDAAKQYQVTVYVANIYGVEWDWTSGGPTKGVRTDAAANFGDPSPAVNSGTGSSPFDSLMPWAGMVKETRDGGVEVKEPKYWFKWTKTGKKLKLQIADGPVEGFHVDPVNMDRGDGLGELDFSYIGRYHCAADNWKSETGKAQKTNVSRSTARNEIHSLGADIWQIDFAQMWYIGMLFLVEFADWNNGRVGLGCSDSGAKENNGKTDAIQYHTGTTAATRDTFGYTQYRNIEGWWDNVYDWLDGCYCDSSGLHIIQDPNQFNDSVNGILLGTPASGYTSDFTIPTQRGLEWALYPSASDGDMTTYTTDEWRFDSRYPCMDHGGNYAQNQGRGLFYINCLSTSTAPTGIGCRLQERPPKAA